MYILVDKVKFFRDNMADKFETPKKINWKYRAKEVKKIISSHSSSYWVKQCLKYLTACDDKEKVPNLTGFFKSVGLWIFYLRDDIAKGLYIKEESMLDKYELIKRIISQGLTENIIDRNAGTATFAIALLQNQDEGGWDKRDKVVDPGQMTITFVNYNLPEPVPSPALPSPDIIEAEVVLPMSEVVPTAEVDLSTVEIDITPTEIEIEVQPSEPITIEPVNKDDDDSSWDMFAD